MLKLKDIKPKKKRVLREEPEHIRFVSWFWQEYPKIRIHHSANGGSRDSDRLKSMLKSKRFKAMGVSAGVYDLFIPVWFLWIEMKPKEGGYLSKEQKIFRDEMEQAGYKTFKANGCQEAIDKLQEFLKGDIPCLTLSSRSPYSLAPPSGLPVLT